MADITIHLCVVYAIMVSMGAKVGTFVLSKTFYIYMCTYEYVIKIDNGVSKGNCHLF